MLTRPDISDREIITRLHHSFGLHISEVTFLPINADINCAVYSRLLRDDVCSAEGPGVPENPAFWPLHGARLPWYDGRTLFRRTACVDEFAMDCKPVHLADWRCEGWTLPLG